MIYYLILLAALLWLMIETNWLRVRLPKYYTPVKIIGLQAIADLIPFLIFLGFVIAITLRSINELREKPKRLSWWEKIKIWFYRSIMRRFVASK